MGKYVAVIVVALPQIALAGGPKLQDPHARYEGRIAEVVNGQANSVNGDYIAAKVKQSVKAKSAQPEVGQTPARRGQSDEVNIGGLRVEPGGKIFANQVIVTTEAKNLNIVGR